jgi:hypothetical protein
MPETTSRLQAWKARIATSKQKMRDLLPEWQKNIDYRRGKCFDSDSDEDRVAVSIDWSMTKSKKAQLFSQVPQVMLTPKHPSFNDAVPVFAKVLNDALTKEKVGVAMDEAMDDTVNAAGIGVVIVSYEARTATTEVPAIDLSVYPPNQQALLIESGQLPMTEVERVVDRRFPIEHISPEDFRWANEFTGADFDKAAWVGRSGRMTWAEAKNAFHLRDADREKVVTSEPHLSTDRLSPNDPYRDGESEVVTFDEVFYWRYRFHPEEKSFNAIHHLVFVNGLDEPVIDEPWKGQRFDPDTGAYLGACSFPIRVCTLTHISGDAIPPSDSAIIRPQVNELVKSRSQMVQQRDHSIPIRWFDVNRVDPQIQDSMMRGEWQGFIPTQGDGTRAIGEVARANYPRENFDFDRVIKSDIQEALSLGPNQMGTYASGERSASEASIVDRSFQTEIGYQRAKVADFFVSIAEVLAGLLALYGDFELPSVGPDGIQRLQGWDRNQINQEFVFGIRADSTVRVDAQQRIAQLLRILDVAGKAPFVNPEPIIREIIELSNLDPATVMVEPQPKGPDQANISVRVSNEDINNPIVLALLMKTGQAPSPDELNAAKALLAASAQGAALAGQEFPIDASQGGVGQANPFEDAHPEWTLPPRVNKRRGDL